MAGRDIGLDFSLYDDGGVPGDSHCLIDNVRLGSMTFDFEGTDPLNGWYSPDDLFLPGLLDAQVSLSAGALVGGGSWLMRIDEGDAFGPFPVTAARDFSAIGSGLTLSFDVAANLSDVVGPWQSDEFVVTVYNWTEMEAVFPALALNAGGIVEISSETAASVVPSPAAVILGILGLGHAGYLCRKHRRQE